ncbi:MAG: hypothetical protein IPH82_19520 [Chloroflexi bacterium]|nr:hypothetical protein [Chloroflexota bacterium]
MFDIERNRLPKFFWQPCPQALYLTVEKILQRFIRQIGQNTAEMSGSRQAGLDVRAKGMAPIRDERKASRPNQGWIGSQEAA